MKIIYGRKPVLEALNSGKDIDRIIIAYGQHGDVINKIQNVAKKKRIKLSQISPSKFKEYDKTQNTQGVVALFSDYNFLSLEELIDESQKSELPFLLILDSIQDPHNLGAIFRTAESAGVDGVIITEYKSASITETVEKTSAGAVSHLKICKVGNLKNALVDLKNAGYWIVGSALENSKEFTAVDYKIPLAVVVGNEEKGIRRLTANHCDFLVRIPMHGKIQSLNVSVATGVLLYEVLKQRSKT